MTTPKRPRRSRLRDPAQDENPVDPPPELEITKRAKEALVAPGPMTGAKQSMAGGALDALREKFARIQATPALSEAERAKFLAKLPGLNIDPSVRTYPAIIGEAMAARDAAREDLARFDTTFGASDPSWHEVSGVTAMVAETRAVGASIVKLYDQAVLQGQMAERQEAVLGAVVRELQAAVAELQLSREQAREDGHAITVLTRWLVSFTIAIFVLTGVLVLRHS